MAVPPKEAIRRDSITNHGGARRRVAAGLAAGVMVAACIVGLSARAQFASGVNVVEVYVTATDQKGEPVTGLRKEDFVVRENGEPQEVTTFAEGEFPLAAAIALDRSFSMAKDRLAVAKSAARVFLGELRPSDESMIIGIGSEVEVIAPRSANRAAQYAALNKLDAFGTTSLHDAIIAALDAMQDAKGRRALVLLSDGDDRFSKASAADVLARARRSDVLIYPIALGRERPSLFAELASLTGGRSFHVREPKQLADTLTAVARELRHQYLLGYSPAKPIVQGQEEWRSIAVTVNRGTVRIRARDGYLAR
jgi:Ca-activated chloride channel family protein